MLPKIKRATLNAETVLNGRGTSSNPPLWQYAKGGSQAKNLPFTKASLRSAQRQIALLDLVRLEPGKTSPYYAKKIKLSVAWVRDTLNEYQEDGVVEINQGWHLTES